MTNKPDSKSKKGLKTIAKQLAKSAKLHANQAKKVKSFAEARRFSLRLRRGDRPLTVRKTPSKIKMGDRMDPVKSELIRMRSILNPVFTPETITKKLIAQVGDANTTPYAKVPGFLDYLKKTNPEKYQAFMRATQRAKDDNQAYIDSAAKDLSRPNESRRVTQAANRIVARDKGAKELRKLGLTADTSDDNLSAGERKAREKGGKQGLLTHIGRGGHRFLRKMRKQQSTPKSSRASQVKQQELPMVDQTQISEDLRKWVQQNWVDIGAPKKGGGFKPCGRSKGEKRRGYPKCVPAAKAASMSKGQRRSAVKRKRAAGNPGGKPTMVATFKKRGKKREALERLGQIIEGKLCPRGKAAAKRKFKVYPSAYANMYASAVCSGKVTPGGKKKGKKK